MSNYAEFVRESFTKADIQRDKGLEAPADIRRYDNIQYGGDNKWQILDVYKPVRCNDLKMPVILSVHGGGWVYGDKDRYQFYCMELARHGFDVVNFSYRLAPEHRFPAAVEDVDKVCRWITDNADTWNFDPDRIFAVADSAGAHILTLYITLLCDNRKKNGGSFCREFSGIFGFSDFSNIKFKAAALNCGVYEIKKTEDPDDMLWKLMPHVLPKEGTKDELRMMNVLNHLSDDFPPTFIMTGAGDFQRMQSVKLAQALTMHEIPYEMCFYGDNKNHLGHVFHLDIRRKEAKTCNADEIEFFTKYMEEKEETEL